MDISKNALMEHGQDKHSRGPSLGLTATAARSRFGMTEAERVAEMKRNDATHVERP
jgi:hypothetical protein